VKVIVLKNYKTNRESTIAEFQTAIKAKAGFLINVDADIIMVPGWFRTIKPFLKSDKVVSFHLSDRFSVKSILGVAVYPRDFIKQAPVYFNRLSSYKPNSHLVKLIYPKNGCYKPLKERKSVIGYHGYEQYYKHIFNRFVIKASRQYKTPLSQYEFDMNNPEDRMAYYGYHYGVKNRIEESYLNHFELLFNMEEKASLTMTLEQFYEKHRN